MKEPSRLDGVTRLYGKEKQRNTGKKGQVGVHDPHDISAPQSTGQSDPTEGVHF